MPTSGMEFIGVGGAGIFNQTGGTNQCAALDVASLTDALEFQPAQWKQKGGSGTYNLSNGLLSVAYENMGTSGNSVFTQTGGTNTTTVFSLGGGSYSATYNLNGGLLQVPGIASDSAVFNFNAGTLQALSVPASQGGGPVGNYTPITVGTDASNIATVDANGQIVQLNAEGATSTLTGLGQLKVIDSAGGGMVQLGSGGANNTYTGGTTVLSGTLQVLSNQALPATGILTIGGPGQVVRAVFDLNGTQQTAEGLVTASSLVPPDLNFQTPGTDLLTIGDQGMNLAGQTAITFGTNPTALGDYELMTGNITGFNAADFVLPTAPAGDTYSLQVVAGNVDLVVAAVPEPGTFALLGAGVLSLLGLAWRRKLVGQAPRA